MVLPRMGKQVSFSVWIALSLSSCGSSLADTDVTASPTVPKPQLITYHPFTASYRAATRRQVEQEFNGQITATQLIMDYYVSTQLVESLEGLRATMTVDSVPVLTGLPPTEADAVTGTTFTAILTPDGQLHDFAGADINADLAHQLSLRFQKFFPRLPPGGASPGVQWADTSDTDAGVRELELVVHSVNHHEAVGWAEWAGEESLLIVTTSDYTVSGSGIEAGQEFVLEGAGIAHTRQYVAPDGRYLGLVSVDTLNSTASLPAIGAIIPIKQTRTDTLTILR